MRFILGLLVGLISKATLAGPVLDRDTIGRSGSYMYRNCRFSEDLREIPRSWNRSPSGEDVCSLPFTPGPGLREDHADQGGSRGGKARNEVDRAKWGEFISEEFGEMIQDLGGACWKQRRNNARRLKVQRGLPGAKLSEKVTDILELARRDRKGDEASHSSRLTAERPSGGDRNGGSNEELYLIFVQDGARRVARKGHCQPRQASSSRVALGSLFPLDSMRGSSTLVVRDWGMGLQLDGHSVYGQTTWDD
ncbi:hypothetical protein WN48_02289 [Eufriesea mexicana]|nr:hypothetical protein WN48_02289 [Eufriesea mexicana]